MTPEQPPDLLRVPTLNTTTLNVHDPQDKELLRLLELIKLCVYHPAFNSNAQHLLD